jgi:hypothetical protein
MINPAKKNSQVSAKVYTIMTMVAERSPTFTKACIALSAPQLTDKLGDLKLKKLATDALLTFAEKTSLAFVLGLCESHIRRATIKPTKNPVRLRCYRQTEGAEELCGRNQLHQYRFEGLWNNGFITATLS